MSRFADDLAKLTAREMQSARRDPDRMAEMIERLSTSLGITVAIAAQGKSDHMQMLLSGVESHVYESASEHIKLGKLLPNRS